MKHYAFGNGNFGCLYDNTEGPYSTSDEAANAASELFDLQDAGREELKRCHYLNLVDYRETFIDLDSAGGEGADYVEVFEVDKNWRAQ